MTRTTERSPAPRFEIVRNLDIPNPRTKGLRVSAVQRLFGKLRDAFEDAYVALSSEVSVHVEAIEDARAERLYTKRLRRSQRIARSQDTNHQASMKADGKAVSANRGVRRSASKSSPT